MCAARARRRAPSYVRGSDTTVPKRLKCFILNLPLAAGSAWQGLMFRTFPRNAASAGRVWRSGMRRRSRNLHDRGDTQAVHGFELL